MIRSMHTALVIERTSRLFFVVVVHRACRRSLSAGSGASRMTHIPYLQSNLFVLDHKERQLSMDGTYQLHGWNGAEQAVPTCLRVAFCHQPAVTVTPHRRIARAPSQWNVHPITLQMSCTPNF